MFQFPFGTMHQLNLDWFLQKFNELLEEWSTTEAGIDNALQAEIDRVEDAMTDLYAARDAAVNAADAAVPAAALAVQDALKSEGFALGEQNGTPVGSGSPYYQTNAKFYSTTAGTYRYLSEAYARGTMGGTPVDPGDAGYEDNAKYYKEAADIDASSASSAAASANADALLSEGYALGEQYGIPVSSGSPYYENNAKYYAQQTALDKDDSDHFKDAANAAALKAEGVAIGEQNGTPVSSGSPYYHNNAKYFADQAAAAAPLAADVEYFVSASPNAFSTSNTYARYSLVEYSGKVWECHTAVTTAGAWTGTDNWTEQGVVADDGNNSGLTAADPITFEHALTLIPKNLNSYRAKLNFLSSFNRGTSANLDIYGYFGGILELLGNGFTIYYSGSRLRGVSISNCKIVEIKTLEFKSTYRGSGLRIYESTVYMTDTSSFGGNIWESPYDGCGMYVFASKIYIRENIYLGHATIALYSDSSEIARWTLNNTTNLALTLEGDSRAIRNRSSAILLGSCISVPEGYSNTIVTENGAISNVT